MNKKIFLGFCFILFSIVFSLFLTSSVKAENFVFNNDLKTGMNHPDVKELQKYMNTHDYLLATSGFGSLSNETTYFGSKTKASVLLFQKASNIAEDGIVGPITRGFLNKIPLASVEVTPIACQPGDLFSVLTGKPCPKGSGLTTPTTPITSGSSSSSSLPAGCTSTEGFSSINGFSCETGLPLGCISAMDFSPTTGLSCVTGLPLFSSVKSMIKNSVRSSEKDILAISFSNGEGTPLNVPAEDITITNISSTEGTIHVESRFICTSDTDALIPTLTLSPKATVNPRSGMVQNFTDSALHPLIYTVTAEDGSTKEYSITVIGWDCGHG